VVPVIASAVHSCVRECQEVWIPTPQAYATRTLIFPGYDVESVLISRSVIGPGVAWPIDNTLVDSEHINRIDNVVNRIRNFDFTNNYVYNGGKTVQWTGTPIEPRTKEPTGGACPLDPELVGFTFSGNLVEGATGVSRERSRGLGAVRRSREKRGPSRGLSLGT